jgi:hypothetical protein
MSRFPVNAVLFFLLLLALFFVWDFSQRIITNARLAQLEQTYTQLVQEEEARNHMLRERKEYVQSDDFVIEYVRGKWRWALPSDTIVIPQITPAPTPTPIPATPTPIPTKTFQQQLFDLLFGP